MTKLLIVLLGCLVAFAAPAVEPRGVVLERDIVELSRTLQARLPTLAVDGMLEAEREAHGWNFVVRVKSDQGGSDNVQVMVRESGAGRSDLRVQGVRVETSLLTSKRAVNAALTAEWTERILKLVEKPD